MMDVLDPAKSKLDGKIEDRQQSRSPKQKSVLTDEAILESEGEKEYKSPMMNPSLKNESDKAWSEEEQSLLAEHLKNRKPGENNPLQEPIKFHKKGLHTLNPVETGLKPEEMIGRTFLMPPTADGSRHRAKIMSEV